MASVSGENVIRPGEEGEHKYHYDSASSAPVAGWEKVDDEAGQIDGSGHGHGHFSQDPKGGSKTDGGWKQV